MGLRSPHVPVPVDPDAFRSAPRRYTARIWLRSRVSLKAAAASPARRATGRTEGQLRCPPRRDSGTIARMAPSARDVACVAPERRVPQAHRSSRRALSSVLTGRSPPSVPAVGGGGACARCRPSTETWRARHRAVQQGVAADEAGLCAPPGARLWRRRAASLPSSAPL